MLKLEKKYKKRLEDLISACKERFSEEKTIALIREKFLPKKQMIIKWLRNQTMIRQGAIKVEFNPMNLLDDFIFTEMGKDVIIYLQEAYPEELEDVFNNLPEIILPCPCCGGKGIHGDNNVNIYQCSSLSCPMAHIPSFKTVEEWNEFVNTVKQ